MTKTIWQRSLTPGSTGRHTIAISGEPYLITTSTPPGRVKFILQCKVRSATVLAIGLAGIVPAVRSAEASSADRWADLRNNPPFTGAGAVAPPAQPVATLELRGWVVEGDQVIFNIFNTTTGKAEWIGQDGTGNSSAIQSYDLATEAVTIVHQSHTLDLRLKRAMIARLPDPVPEQNEVAQHGRLAAPDTEGNRARLENVAEEIRRRRALRQRALENRGEES